MELTKFKAGMKAAIKDVVKGTDNDSKPFSCLSIDEGFGGKYRCEARCAYENFLKESGTCDYILNDHQMGAQSLLLLRIFLMQSFELEAINSEEYKKW